MPTVAIASEFLEAFDPNKATKEMRKVT